MAGPSVELLLATYNSEHYLAELLQSLASQTHDDFVLVVSDDGSRDATLEIIAQFAPRFRHPLRILENTTPSGSAMMNFARLLGAARADYVLLVDHDDIWHPDKIASGLAQVRAVEAQRGSEHPVLAHGDLRVIDGEGAVSRPSFWAMKQIDPACSQSLRRTLIHASVVGCTTTMNRALVDACLPIPQNAVMHDWWISLIAAACGTVVYDPVPHIDYRIHGNNVSNPREASASAAIGESNYRAIMQQKLAVRARQAAALAERLEPVAPAAAALARRFAQLPDIGFVARRVSILRHRFLFPGIWRNLALAVAS
jgi:glycosyltransferase involved in cell wall biosynthesis